MTAATESPEPVGELQPAQDYTSMSREQLARILKRAGGLRENIPDPEAFLKAWGAAPKPTDPVPIDPEIAPEDLSAVKDCEARHPDFFPPGTPTSEKVKHIKKIGKVQADEKAERVNNFQNLDRAVEAANAEREYVKTRDSLTARAREIYRSGEFVKYCRETFRETWYGDQHILDAVLLQAAALFVSNISTGINLHVSGKTQSGKSDAVRHALKFLPDSLKYSGTFSRLALYHSRKFHDRMIVFSDDTVFDPETASILRGILTAWEEGSDRETMVGKEWATVKVPKRLNMILTSVESVSQETDDGQDESRFLTLEILRDQETERVIRQFMQEPKPDISGNLEIIHAVWNIIPETDVTLQKTIERNLPFREFARYLSLVKACALLHNRTTTTEDDLRFVDLLLQRSRPMIASDIAGLTKNEKAVMEFLKSRPEVRSMKEIQQGLGIPLNGVYRALRGRTGTVQNPTGGLLMKERHVTIVWLDGTREWGVQYV